MFHMSDCIEPRQFYALLISQLLLFDREITHQTSLYDWRGMPPVAPPMESHANAALGLLERVQVNGAALFRRVAKNKLIGAGEDSFSEGLPPTFRSRVVDEVELSDEGGAGMNQ